MLRIEDTSGVLNLLGRMVKGAGNLTISLLESTDIARGNIPRIIRLR